MIVAIAAVLVGLALTSLGWVYVLWRQGRADRASFPPPPKVGKKSQS